MATFASTKFSSKISLRTASGQPSASAAIDKSSGSPAGPVLAVWEAGAPAGTTGGWAPLLSRPKRLGDFGDASAARVGKPEALGAAAPALPANCDWTGVGAMRRGGGPVGAGAAI